jgi:hypothetical protein
MHIVNVDLLDDDEPHILVQRYDTGKRVFQVFRKPTSPDEQFAVSPGISIDADLYWSFSSFLNDPPEADEDVPEIFASVYLDEENPPSHDLDEVLTSAGEEWANIVLNAGTDNFAAEAVLDIQGDALKGITGTSIDDVILQTVERLDAWFDEPGVQEAIAALDDAEAQ